MNNVSKHLSKDIEFILCSCGSAEHQMILHGLDNPINEIAFEIHLNTFDNIFRRIWCGIKYIFGHKSKYGEWDEILVDEKHLKQMIQFINRYLKNRKKQQNDISKRTAKI